MILGFGLRCRRAPHASLVGLLTVCALVPASASAGSGPGGAELSPRLAELAQPAVRALPPAKQAQRLDLAASGPGSLLRDGSRVVVEVRFAGGALVARDELRAAGAEIIAASRRYQTVAIAIAPGLLPALAAVPGVKSVIEKREPLVFGASSTAAAVGAQCEGGEVISEGVAQLQVDDARGKYGLDGAGVSVGVLSDSFDQADAATDAGDDVASSDLPGPANPCAAEKAPVNVLEDFPSPQATDEGRGMLQIVHDIAPAAELAFATAFFSELSFAQNIERLAKPVAEGGAEADVIVDDVAWFEEPFFQDGPVAVAVDKVAAGGVAYFSAAGNNNLLEGGNEIASWEAPAFRDSASCPAAVSAVLPPGTAHCMDFDPGAGVDDTFAITVSPGATLTVDLQWAEPWFGVEADLDAYLLDGAGGVIAAEEADNVTNTQRPVEIPQWENNSGSSKTVRLAINRCAGVCNGAASESATPAIKVALLQNGSGVTATEYPVSLGGDTVGPTIFGHAAASGAVATAAVHYSNPSLLEKFSSRGPVTHYFEPVDGTTPAAALPSAEEIDKPDIAATDCGATTFFGSFVSSEDTWRFCGTSAAAPHAAAVAALQLEAKPAATVTELRGAQTSTAVPVGAFGPNAVGAGLLDADAAIASLLPPAVVTIFDHPAIRTADSTPTFGFKSEPPAAEFACTVDGGTPQPCLSPFTVPIPLADGPHVFAVAGVDVVGSASFSFTVDTTAPAISFGQRPPELSRDRSPVFAFTASEPAALSCSLDGVAVQPCKSPHAPAPLADGAHSFTVTATDQAGNVRTVPIEFAIDTVAPAVAFTRLPAPRSTEVLPVLGFLADEPATFACSIDGAPAQACASPTAPLAPLADGGHGFEVLATDRAGNVGAATTSFSIDTRAPDTSFAGRPRAVVSTRKATVRATFRFAADEEGASFACRVDRGPWQGCAARLARRFSLGRHTVRVRARDELGNVDATPAIARFRVVRTPGSARSAAG